MTILIVLYVMDIDLSVQLVSVAISLMKTENASVSMVLNRIRYPICTEMSDMRN